MWLSDEYRTPQAIEALTQSYFVAYVPTLFYEAGDFQALIGFINIHPESKCDMTLTVIDKDIWSRDFVRASKNLMDLVMKEFRLKRISTDTPDLRIVKMAKMAGFHDEGERPDDFKWDGKYYTRYILGYYG